jgi:uncharacterized repeat protein (TIGR01451 family)
VCILKECQQLRSDISVAKCLGRALIAFLLWPFLFLAMSGLASATVSITTTTSTANLAAAITAGNSGITLTGTPVLAAGSATNVSGTFTTTSSNLGIAGGIVLGTGNVSQIPGNPVGAANLSGAGSGIGNGGPVGAAGSEFDITTFTFSFIPNPGVNRMSLASVFASEEYNEYVNTIYTDNFSMRITGGVYANQNVALVPGTALGTDINNVSNLTNPGQYRDNTSTTAPPLNDIRFDGATTVFINAFDVVPGTTYTITIRIADVADATYDSAVFVSTSTILNSPPALDLNNAVAGTGYTTMWVQGNAAIAVAATDDRVTDDGTTISSATVTISNLVAGDLLTVGTLPAGIAAGAYNSGTGSITLAGVATLAQYQTALQAIGYSSTATVPAGPNKTLNVVVNDGVDNSNIAVATIQMATLRVTKTASAPTVNQGASNTLTDANDRITFTFVVQNTGTVNMTAVVPIDNGVTFNGVAGTGTLGAFSPASATVNAGASQTFTAVYTLSAADVMNGAGVTNGVVNTARSRGTVAGGAIATSSQSTATTSITTVAGVTVTKTAGVPTIAAGPNATFTDAGDTITFSYLVRNVGSVALTNVFPSDVGPRFNSIVGTNALSSFTPTAPVNLAVGATQTFTATYVLSQTDVANAVGITNGVSNVAAATGRSPAGTTITAPNSTAFTTVPAAAAMNIDKTFVLTDTVGLTPVRADLNEVITYTYTVTNTGNVPINNVTISDLHGTPGVVVPLGAGGVTSETLTVAGPYGAGASTPDATSNNGVWTRLAPGATVTFTYTHTVTQAEIDNG